MQPFVQRLRRIALDSLRRMFVPAEGQFVFRIRKNSGGMVSEGRSKRYTAIALIGLANESEAASRRVLAGAARAEIAGRFLAEVGAWANLGDVALTLWAGRACADASRAPALDRLRELDPLGRPHATVELAWSLTALCVGPGGLMDESLARGIARRLLSCFGERSSVFSHWATDGSAGGTRIPIWRRHLACFADQVYPIQALSHYGGLTRDGNALEAARRCAEHICRLQGEAGQWWWHYDVRTGDVVEGYPVYAVHQDAMAPMALLAAAGATGVDFSAAIGRGLDWLAHSPEIGASLVDESSNVIWRKVCRREPGKLVRGMQAAVSCCHRSLRVPGVNVIFPPISIDYESRPYHMGWILYAFPERADDMEGEEDEPEREDVAIAPSV